jgi:hypothetical protein
MLTITSPGSYVASPGVSALNLTKGFTIECWAKVTSASNGAALMDKATYGIFVNNDSNFYGMIRHSSKFFDYAPSVDSSLNWHHYAFVFTPGDSMRFYIDSIEVTSEVAPMASIDSNTDSLRIGLSQSGNAFTGSIDELRIWNTPRSLASIQQTLFTILPENDSGLVLYYSFDDNAGSPRVHDFSGHGRDGFIRGANAEIVPSSSPMQNASPGFALAAREPRIIIPTLRCATAFDTVIHVRNLGATPIFVDTVGFHLGVAFSIVPNPDTLTLPADSNIVDSLRLHFEPNTGGVFDDSLYIASSSTCGGRIVIGLHASYDSVGLTSSPSILNFGPLMQCQFPKTRSITLTNTSVTDSVTIVSFLPPPGAGIRVLDSFPIRLAARQDKILTVELDSGSRGPVNVSLGFSLDKCSREAIVNATAVRQRAELTIPANIDFGTTPNMIAGVTRDTIIVVTNTGDVPNEISGIGVGPDSVLEILDGRKGILIAQNDTLQVHIRMHATICGHDTELLKLKSYECSVDTTTAISISLTPPAPVTTPTLSMGISCLPRDTTIFVSNPNAIPVQLDTITFSTNAVFQNAPFFPFTIPANDSVPIQMTFNPALDGSFMDTAFLQMSPCGAGTAIFAGQIGFAGLNFDAPQLLFGRGCKTDLVSEQDTLNNFTSDTVTLNTNTYSGSLRFSVIPFSYPVIIPPGASKIISVGYSPTLGSLDTGTFTFLSSNGCEAASFKLRGSREIANATWATASGEFDTICPGNDRDETFDLIDHGIDSIDIVSATVSGSGFTLLQSPSTFAGNGKFTVRFAPSATQDYFGALTVVADSCGTSFTLPLHGTGGVAPEIVLSDNLHDFDSIPAGDSVTYCIAVTNPSCQPISAQIDTSNLTGGSFKITQLPNLSQIARGDTAYVCIQFSPTAGGTFQATIQITSDSGAPQTITLHGVSLAPNVLFHPHAIDFGYVLVNGSETLMLHDSNYGDLGTAITEFHDSTEFVVQPPDSLAPFMGDSLAITFNPIRTGPDTNMLLLTWDGHTDTVILQGFGTEKGLQLSKVGLDFGNVHIGTDSTLPLYLFATNNFPTIDSISVHWGTPLPRDTFSTVAHPTLPYTIQNDHDTLTLQVTYKARREQLDTDYLVIYSGADSAIVALRGRGVEAHPRSSPASIGFTPTVINTPNKVWFVQIWDTGGYPLYINSIYTTDPAFTASPISPTQAIQPGGTFFDTVTFTPTRARTVSGTLGFVTSYHDSVLTVQLTGTGIYPNGQGPSFGYTVADRYEEPGQNDSIPISITNGQNLSKIDYDTVTLDIRFDPQMVMMSGADGGSTSDTVSSFTHLDDSTVEVGIPMSNYTGGTIMRLYTQALLGPHPVSPIYVIDSQSTPIATQSSTVGQFTVEDCGGLVNGVVFAGPYSTNAIVPNPAGDKVSLAFEIGWDASVTLDIYNAIGQNARHIDAGSLKTGAHTLTFDVSDLPQGRYVYRLTSLDYRSEGALVVVR